MSTTIDPQLLAWCRERRLVMDVIETTREETESLVQREIHARTPADEENLDVEERLDRLDMQRADLDAKIAHRVAIMLLEGGVV